jgi:hypothetical protein
MFDVFMILAFYIYINKIYSAKAARSIESELRLNFI